MSVTFKVSDGQVEFSSATGQANTVEDQEKCSQDLAQVLLQEYDPTQDYGSKLHRLNLESVPQASELFVRHYVAEAVKLLDQKQLEDPYITSEEKISKISKLFTVNMGNGGLGYYVAVDTEANGVAETAALKPTSLEHLFQR